MAVIKTYTEFPMPYPLNALDVSVLDKRDISDEFLDYILDKLCSAFQKKKTLNDVTRHMINTLRERDIPTRELDALGLEQQVDKGQF